MTTVHTPAAGSGLPETLALTELEIEILRALRRLSSAQQRSALDHLRRLEGRT